MKLPALSLRQPWAWLVLHGGKTIENRIWQTRFRGRFLIHAAQGMSRQEYLDGYAFAAPFMALGQLSNMPVAADLSRGGIVGLAELVYIQAPEEYPAEPWRMSNQYGFQLGGIRELPFLKCSGWHKFWSTDRLRSTHPEWLGWEIADEREKDSSPGDGVRSKVRTWAGSRK